MKQLDRVLLVIGIGLACVVMEPSQLAVWGQTENSQTQQAQKLLDIAIEQTNKGQLQKAIATLEQALLLAQQQKDRKLEATILTRIGLNYANIGEPKLALDYYNQSLLITKQVGDRSGEASTLSNIGLVYADIGQPQLALAYYNQSLPIIKEVGDRAREASTLNNIGNIYALVGQQQTSLAYYNQSLIIRKQVGDRAGEATTLSNIGNIYALLGQPKLALDYYNQSLVIIRQVGNRAGEATTLSNIGNVYDRIGELKLALDYYNQSLPIFQQVGNHAGEATTLSNIGGVYARIGELNKATTYFKVSLTRILKIGVNITKDEGLNLLQLQENTKAVISILIKSNKFQNAYELAYEQANFINTVSLIDYIRFINPKLKDPASQKAINEWNQLNQQLQLVRQKLQEKFSEPLSRQMRELEAQVFKKGEEISQSFPEVAEIFETTPIDISRLQANIPTGTTLIHPVVLTDTNNAPNKIALFMLTKNSLTVKQISISKQFYKLVEQTYEQLTNRLDDKYLDNLESLYNLLIAPVEAEIQATKPQQLGIIANGALRYIPFDALYDSKNNQFLLEKYPVSYLTRLSTRSSQSLKTNSSPAQKRVLAFGNPSPNGLLALTNAEIEVKKIADTLPGSKFFTGDKATLDSFKILAPQFPLLHLATHGCFQRGGCPKLKLKENILVFANNEELNIADAARLGLENVDLITLSACQTALQTDSSGKPIIDNNDASITGLAYLFERAGAKAVIANLWSIDDQATQDIMVKFYENLKEGKSKTQALREAKLTQIKRHPFFWSSFVLIGDPN
nr:tetratricopeptide repeat protein [Nostoc sp. DedSLP01]